MKKYRGRIVALMTFCFLVAIMGGVNVWRYINKPNINPDTFCPLDGDYARTAVLVDATDSLNLGQIKDIKENLNNMRRNLELHEWVGVFVVNENNLTVPKPIIALCNPGNEKTANPFIENPDEARRQYEKKFREPMESAIDELVNLPEQKESPIFEMIGAVALDSNFDSTKKRRLIIVSDMLQNVPAYSHYQGDMDYDYDKWRATDYARDIVDSTLLRGVDVKILYVKRDKNLQKMRHPQFWRRYFDDDEVGAHLSLVVPI